MTVLGITGHQGLPVETVALLEERLPVILRDLSVSEMVGSLAQGADQVCAAIAVDQGVPLRVIIPSQSYDVTFDGEGLARYHELLQRASSVVTLSYGAPSETAFFAAGRQVADESDVLIAVWDGQPAAGLGGTGDVVAYARSKGTRVEVLWPEGVVR
ncbi:hypothetical protein JK386_06260 [Nocardioides sp. zg-536]|uniref:Uncharacterized protein n=1 Tax=Nocardioides faecalis TaxID=2803858 RepID=A0A938Y939_9ACTN|nr:hypothetical protein [Nocardioides faecalis]MBM9459499.1 hypothetical protein [Nocardioides faecalis]QVI59401.1 hypothetical protein KG111_03255 [Nocardioides faecalis]